MNQLNPLLIEKIKEGIGNLKLRKYVLNGLLYENREFSN